MLEQDPRPPEGSAARKPEGARVADLLRRHRDDVLADWERSAQARHAGREGAGPRLLDPLPELLDWLVASLERAPDEAPVEPPVHLSDMHAFERLDPGLGPHEVAMEYGHLRRCILRRLEAAPVRPRGGELARLDEAIDQAVSHAVTQCAPPPERTLRALERAVTFREQLLAVLGHELRNPLNAITTSAFQLARAEELEGRERQAVERIRRSAARMARMIGDILDFARSRLGGVLPVARQRMDMAEVGRATLEELQVTYPERRLVFEAHGDTTGQWDPDRVTQALGNLVVNALQHGREGAPVRVTARGEGPDVVLEVHNAGEPIAPELLPRLFDPFKGSTPPAGSGSLGLGLFIVQRIAQAHGGTVQVRSSAAEGTTLAVRWPREAPAAGPVLAD